MRGIVVKIVVNAIAIWVAALIVPGVTVSSSSSLGNRLLTLAILGALFGVVNAFIKPVVSLFSLPIIFLTLGLFALVINAFMLKIVDWVSGALGISFSSGPFFWSTIGAAIVVSIVSMILSLVIPDGK